MSSKIEGAGHSEAGPNHPHLHQHCLTTQLMCPLGVVLAGLKCYIFFKELKI
jgi:hypothetical protein